MHQLQHKKGYEWPRKVEPRDPEIFLECRSESPCKREDEGVGKGGREEVVVCADGRDADILLHTGPDESDEEEDNAAAKVHRQRDNIPRGGEVSINLRKLKGKIREKRDTFLWVG